MSMWTVETLAASALLMALVMMLRGAVARHLGARVAYWLWVLPLLRLACPLCRTAVPPPPCCPRRSTIAAIIFCLQVTGAAPVPAQSFPWLEAAIAL